MYVRLAFAIAAHLDPEILLVDEVLAVGDTEFQKKCLGKMEDVATKEGRTVIFVSHNIDAICHLCSRCILLGNGKIEKSGNTADVVASYLGSAQQQAPVIDFKPTTSAAGFRSAGLYGPEGRATTAFDANTPVQLKCSFLVQRAIAGLQVSFSVFNFKGEQIFYSTSSMASPAISVEQPGIHDISATIPSQLLLPGRYFINLALHVPNTHLYDRREQSLCFQIIGLPGGYHGFPSEELGHVYANVNWQKGRERSVRPENSAGPAVTEESGTSRFNKTAFVQSDN
jgi:lipopolysaccharide transport system ATP-binding protein